MGGRVLLDPERDESSAVMGRNETLAVHVSGENKYYRALIVFRD